MRSSGRFRVTPNRRGSKTRDSRCRGRLPQGLDRSVKIDITEFGVHRILADPSKNHGIVLGPLTNDKRGVFVVIKEDGLGAGMSAQIRILE